MGYIQERPRGRLSGLRKELLIWDNLGLKGHKQAESGDRRHLEQPSVPLWLLDFPEDLLTDCIPRSQFLGIE